VGQRPDQVVKVGFLFCRESVPIVAVQYRHLSSEEARLIHVFFSYFMIWLAKLTMIKGLTGDVLEFAGQATATFGGTRTLIVEKNAV
jgi:hypothetical protein